MPYAGNLTRWLAGCFLCGQMHGCSRLCHTVELGLFDLYGALL
jgi:hypothetical protein